VFIDDLGFEDGDSAGPRAALVAGRRGRGAPGQCPARRDQSNRRAIVPRHLSEQDDPINPRDAVDDRLALADRFGLSIGFHNCSQDDYLAIIGRLLRMRIRLDWDEATRWNGPSGAARAQAGWPGSSSPNWPGAPGKHSSPSYC
jgi:predicted AAA+ superfamily ATPase